MAADPVGAFRPVAGIVLVGFVAGLVTVAPVADPTDDRTQGLLTEEPRMATSGRWLIR